MRPPTRHAACRRASKRASVFRSIFGAYPDAMLLVDATGAIVMANPRPPRCWATSEELVGLDVDALVPDAMRPRHASYREAYGRAPRTRPMGTQMELVAQRKDGTEVMVEIALSPLPGHDVPLVVAAIRDIGAYPRVKQALQRARYSEHLAQFGRAGSRHARAAGRARSRCPLISPEALEVDASMVVVLESRRASSGGRVVSPVPGAKLDAQRRGTTQHLGRPSSWRSEARSPSPTTAPRRPSRSGRRSSRPASSASWRFLAVRGRVIGMLAVRRVRGKRFSDEQQRFLGALASLLSTSLQRAQTEEALNHAQRLETVGQLTGGIAHDLRPAHRDPGQPPGAGRVSCAGRRATQGRQMVAAAARASRRAAELTGKLLAFSRRQVLQPIPRRPEALLRSLADMLRRTVDQHVRIELDTTERLDGRRGSRPAGICLAQHRDQRARCDAQRRAPQVRSGS